jgi:pteridine reductase
MRNSIAYCSSKAALVQAVRCAARELAPHVRVNAVSPAIIEHTPMTTNIDAAVQLQRGWSEEEALEYERKLIPMGRRATKEEVAQVVLQTLAGPQFMTGSNIEITGGK